MPCTTTITPPRELNVRRVQCFTPLAQEVRDARREGRSLELEPIDKRPTITLDKPAIHEPQEGIFDVSGVATTPDGTPLDTQFVQLGSVEIDADQRTCEVTLKAPLEAALA